MSRFINPVPQYLDDNSDPLVNGKLYFFKSGTNTQLVTYADAEQTIPNTHPVLLDAAGRTPNVFFSGTAKAILTADKPEYGLTDVQIWERDPISDDALLGNFEDWDQIVIYEINDFVIASDGEIYRSTVNDNQGNDPLTNPEDWEQVRFIGVWNEFITYSIGEVVQTDSGDLYASKTDSNLNNNPDADNDGTNWVPAIDAQKVLEPVSTVIPQTGGGTLTALRINEIRDASAYDLPLANSIKENQTIIISQPDRYISNEPVIQVSGSDTITDENGADANGEILFDQDQSVEITLTSDGVSNWSL